MTVWKLLRKNIEVGVNYKYIKGEEMYKLEIFEFEERKKTLLCDNLQEVDKMKDEHMLLYYEPYFLVKEEKE